jgi:hypothetical protein
MTPTEKLEQFADRELRRNIQHILVDNGSGTVVAFGVYVIHQQSKLVTVSTPDQDHGEFSNRRTALSWCTADKFKRYNLAREIQQLDQRRRGLIDDLYCRTALRDRSRDAGFKETVTTKLEPKVERLRYINTELEKCINQAKYLQIRGFNNETARTLGSQASKANS